MIPPAWRDVGGQLRRAAPLLVVTALVLNAVLQFLDAWTTPLMPSPEQIAAGVVLMLAVVLAVFLPVAIAFAVQVGDGP